MLSPIDVQFSESLHAPSPNPDVGECEFVMVDPDPSSRVNTNLAPRTLVAPTITEKVFETAVFVSLSVTVTVNPFVVSAPAGAVPVIVPVVVFRFNQVGHVVPVSA